MSLDRIPIPRVLHRPLLILGGEREPVQLTLLLCALVAVPAMNLVSFVVAGVIWAVLMPFWVHMAKADPQMLFVYLRSIRYRGYYPAQSRPYRVNKAGNVGTK